MAIASRHVALPIQRIANPRHIPQIHRLPLKLPYHEVLHHAAIGELPLHPQRKGGIAQINRPRWHIRIFTRKNRADALHRKIVGF